jgi:hypothetical protein
MRLDSDFLDRWTAIVNDVEKHHCPVACVKKVVFRTGSKRQKTINFKKLRSQGLDNDSIEMAVAAFITSNEGEIVSMELILDIEAVAEIIQPQTDKLLKGM